MKTRIQMVCFLIVAFLAVVPGLAQQTYKFQIPADLEPIYGTWLNPEYSGINGKTAQKWVYYSWGYGEGFKTVADEKPFARFTYILVEKWTDSKGNTWYKELEQLLGQKNYLLCRISKDGKTLEQVFRSAGFPAESDMSPKHPNYWIYRRQ